MFAHTSERVNHVSTEVVITSFQSQFLNGIDILLKDGIEGTISKCADDTRMGGVADTLDDRFWIRNDLDKLENGPKLSELNSVRQMQSPVLGTDQPHAQMQIGECLARL